MIFLTFVFVLITLMLWLLVFCICKVGISPPSKSGPILVNKHGLKYQFVKKIGHWYHCRFYDKESNKWIYVMDSGIDFDWYGTKYDYLVYRKRTFSSERKHDLDWYKTIDQVVRENENWIERIKENNKRQDKYREDESIRKKREGFY